MKVFEYRFLLWALVLVVLVLGWVTLRLYDRVGDLQAQLSNIEREGFNQLSITVAGIDQEQGRRGQYFQFDAGQFDTLLGRDAWSGGKFIAVVPSRGMIEPVRLWEKKGEEHLGFGRTEDDIPTFQWSVGDEIFILHSP